ERGHSVLTTLVTERYGAPHLLAGRVHGSEDLGAVGVTNEQQSGGHQRQRRLRRPEGGEVVPTTPEGAVGSLPGLGDMVGLEGAKARDAVVAQRLQMALEDLRYDAGVAFLALSRDHV